MLRVGHESVIAQMTSEQPLAERDTLLFARAIESIGAPGLVGTLDDERTPAVAERVAMRLVPAAGAFFEVECERVEGLLRTEPHVAAAAHVDIRAKTIRVAFAHRTVGAVGGDHQLRVGEGTLVVGFAFKTKVDAELVGAFGEDVEQGLPRDAAEAVAAAANHGAAVIDVDIVPVDEALGDTLVGDRIGAPQAV